VITLAGAGNVDTLLEPGPSARLGVARTRGGVRAELTGAVAWVLVEGGRGTLTLDGDLTEIDGRDDVFDTAGWSALVGPVRCSRSMVTCAPPSSGAPRREPSRVV
jgi:hypothetical protein